MLEVTGLRASYGQAQVVRGVTFAVAPEEILAVIGANGAGKTTLARSVAGLHEARLGRIAVDGRDMPAGRAIDAARAGVALVPQGRRIFRSLTVQEHLAIAERQARRPALSRHDLFALFPRLAERLGVRARSLSGGEQQMLAIARAVAVGPKVLVLDEPTEGLAPTMVARVGEVVRQLAGTGVAVLLLEQHGSVPLKVADRIIEMQRGGFHQDGSEAADPDLAKGGTAR
jgi:branched-chain amino acid transport system ATP-binding protein